MKLKLDQKDDITIISVSEGIEAAQIPVLKAGLKKLFQAGRLRVILDLLSIKNEVLLSQPMLDEISNLPKWARDQGAQMAVVSTAAGVGTASTKEEGISSLKTPLAGLQILEAKLQTQLKMFEAQKADLTQKLTGAAANQAKNLLNENAARKKTIVFYEENIRRFLKKRTEPHRSEGIQSRKKQIEDLLTTVLVQDGALAPKDSK